MTHDCRDRYLLDNYQFLKLMREGNNIIKQMEFNSFL